MDNESGIAHMASHDTAMPKLKQIPTSVTLSAEQFEKLYLNPLSRRQPEMTKKLGNPTPLYVFASTAAMWHLTETLAAWVPLFSPPLRSRAA